MPVERVYADPHVKADVGRVALQRGPVVYCLEGVDNDGQVRNLVLPPDAKLTASFDKDLLGGVVVVKGEAQAVTGLDDDGKPVVKPTPVPGRAVLRLGQPQAGADGRLAAGEAGAGRTTRRPGRPLQRRPGPRLARLRQRHAGRGQRRRDAEKLQRPEHPAA